MISRADTIGVFQIESRAQMAIGIGNSNALFWQSVG